MLTKIKIDGFRSLVDFSIQLKRGLNVLVGANGSGKTNFVSFLDFLGELISQDLNAAISVSQGAGAVFSREKFQSDRADLTFHLEGTLDSESLQGNLYFFRQKVPLEGSYSYFAKVTYLEKLPAVFIGQETLTIHAKGAPPLIIERESKEAGKRVKQSIKLHPADHRFIADTFNWITSVGPEGFGASDWISRQISPEQSILSEFLQEIPAIAAITFDLTSLRSINIDPALARKASPVGIQQEINSKGEGLSGTLYTLQNKNFYSRRRVNNWRLSLRQREKSYESILSWCREINPDVKKIETKLDFREALIRASIVFHSSAEGFSLSRVSDGTIKWLTLLTVLHASASLASIEEPENFLHPLMQESFAKLCRLLSEEDVTRNFVISTHSPTLIDCCTPEELIIFESTSGISFASRVVNAQQLNKKIKENRFGLGYYYRTGGVYGADRGDS